MRARIRAWDGFSLVVQQCTSFQYTARPVLRVRRATRETLEVEGRTRTRSLALGAAAFAALAALPVITPGALTSGRLIGAAALATLALALALWSRPRRRRFVVHLPEQLLREQGRPDISLRAARAVHLTGAGARSSTTAHECYRAELELPDGSRELLFESNEPAAVLRDVQAFVDCWPLPVRPGWGLPSDFELSSTRAAPEPALDVSVTDLELVTPVHASEKAAGITVLVGSVATAVIMSLIYSRHLQRGNPGSVLSVALGAGTVAMLLLIAAVLLTDRLHVRVARDRITLRRQVLGWPRTVTSVERPHLAGIWSVSPAGADPQHLLLRTERSFESVRCVGDASRRLAGTLSANLRQTRAVG
jgi:hypothetical protein